MDNLPLYQQTAGRVGGFVVAAALVLVGVVGVAGGGPPSPAPAA